MDGEPCDRCLSIVVRGVLPIEAVHPVPPNAPPLARNGSGPCCKLCAAADGLQAFVPDLAWEMPVGVGVLDEHQDWLTEHGAYRTTVETEPVRYACHSPSNKGWEELRKLRAALGLEKMKSVHAPGCVCGGVGYTEREEPVEGPVEMLCTYKIKQKLKWSRHA